MLSRICCSGICFGDASAERSYLFKLTKSRLQQWALTCTELRCSIVIAAVTCGLGGALVAQQNQYINSDFINLDLSIFILLVVLFGGSQSLIGPLIGSVLLVLIDALLARWPSLQHFVYGSLLLFALYNMPTGLAGVLSAILRKRGPVNLPRKPARTSLVWVPPVTSIQDRGSKLLEVDQDRTMAACIQLRTCHFHCSMDISTP